MRDAAAKLPNAIGTRADICELTKESQYIIENAPDDKLSNIVSGALDRLHYESDPCVKYDPEKKMWIYLHKNRGANNSGNKTILNFIFNYKAWNNEDGQRKISGPKSKMKKSQFLGIENENLSQTSF